jgi:hypothetical protein
MKDAEQRKSLRNLAQSEYCAALSMPLLGTECPSLCRLGFAKEWIKRQETVSDKHTEEEYHRHFVRGVRDCEV